MKQITLAAAAILAIAALCALVCVPSDGIDAADAQTSYVSDADTVSASWYDANSDEYTLSSVTELIQFRDMVNSGTTFQGKTVNLVKGTYDISGSQWTPIGITIANEGGTFTDNPFKGIFNGNGSTITGLTMTSADIPHYNGMDTGDYYAYGFFGGVVGGTVKDLTFTDFEINAPGISSQNNTVAVAVGAVLFSGEVSGITVDDGTVTGISRTAGIVGYIGGAKTGNDGPANYDNTAVMETITVSGNTNNADIVSQRTESSHGTAAGIISTTNLKSMSGGEYIITNNVNNGAATGYFAAGIVASDFSNSTASKVTGNKNHGAITAKIDGTTGTLAVGIINVKNSGSTGSATVIENNINTGSIESSGTAAGIVSTSYNGTSISNNKNFGNVTGYRYAAGIVSIAHVGVTISDNENSGVIFSDAREDTAYVGQLAAYVSDVTVDATKFVAGGSVMRYEGQEYVGNVVGQVSRGKLIGIDSSYDIGAVFISYNSQLELEDVNVDTLRAALNHTPSSMFTIVLTNSEIGEIVGTGTGATDVHTGMVLRILGGKIGTMSFNISGHDGAGTTFGLIVDGNATIGAVRVETNDFIARAAVLEGSSLGWFESDGNMYLSVTVDGVQYDGQPIKYVVFNGTRTDIVEKLTQDVSVGIINYITTDVLSNLLSESSPVDINSNVNVVVQAETYTLKGTVTPAGCIVGALDGISGLVISEGASYSGLTAATYFWDSDTGSWIAPVARIGETLYGSLENAFWEAEPGDTVVLLRDVTVNGPIEVLVGVTFDPQSYTLSGNYEFDLTEPSASLTVPEGFTASVVSSEGYVVQSSTSGGKTTYTLAYTVIRDPNYEGATVLTDVVPCGTEFQLGNDLTRTGYTFAGWNDARDGTGLEYTYVYNTNVTVYAQWEPISYTLTFNTNGAGEIQPVVLEYDEKYELPTPVLEGFRIEKWSDGVYDYFGGSEVSGLASEEGDTVLLTALWSYYSQERNEYGGTTTIQMSSEVDVDGLVTATFTGQATDSSGNVLRVMRSESTANSRGEQVDRYSVATALVSGGVINTEITAEAIDIDYEQLNFAVLQYLTVSRTASADYLWEIDAQVDETYSGALTLPAAFLDSVNGYNTVISVVSEIGIMDLNDDVVAALASTRENITVAMAEASASGMTEAQIQALGRGYPISLTATAESGTVHELGGTATISVHYQDAWGNPDELRVFYIDENGVRTAVACHYDAEGRAIVFETDHFSLFAVENVSEYTITAYAGYNGSVSPESSTVAYGGSVTVTITPNKGYEVGTVTVDGVPVDFVGTEYTFADVSADHTIEVTFVPEGGPRPLPSDTLVIVAAAIVLIVAFGIMVLSRRW